MLKKNVITTLIPIVLLFFIGMYLVPFRMMGAGLVEIPGDLGDGRLNNYFLEHGFKWISGQEPHFWNAPFFYPVERTMSFADNHLGTLPFYAMFRFLHCDRETAYQLWFLVVFSLNYISCVWALRKLAIIPWGAAAGAFLFTFSMPVIAQMGHSQLLPRFMIPLAFYSGFRYLERPSLSMLAILCGSVVYQFYCSMYMGFFLVLGLAALFGVSLTLQQERIRTFRGLIGMTFQDALLRTAVVLGSCLCLLPLIVPYHQTALQYGVRGLDEIKLFLPRLQSYLSPTPESLLWNWLSPVGNTLPAVHEHHLFMGAMPFLAALALVILHHRHRTDPVLQRGLTALAALVILALLTLHMKPLFYRLILFVPGMLSVRAVSRIIMLDLFLAAMIVGAAITKTAEHPFFATRRNAVNVLGAVLAFAVVSDQTVRLEGLAHTAKAASQQRAHAVEAMLTAKYPTAKVFAYLPQGMNDPAGVVYTHIDAMMAAQDLNISTVNGFSGNFPFGYFDTLYKHFDQCENLFIWKSVAAQYYRPENGRSDLVHDIAVVGRDGCSDGNRHYAFSFMDAALPVDAFRTRMTFPVNEMSMRRGQYVTVPTMVMNSGSSLWRSLNNKKTKYQLMLSCRWLSSDRAPLGDYESRDALPYDLAPGETASIAVTVQSPDKPGTYYLEFDMIQEAVAWFRERGSSTSLLKVNVL